MECLRTYLNSLDSAQQASFAERCGTSIGYLRKAISTKQRLRIELVINLDRESGGVVGFESLRPDVDWAYLRGTATTDQHEAA